ncbi:hypothetical protein G210_1774 [Candida maltosa Xu316]|uniref:Uncharacterized protein n=1 Tax=Candida maltosa (strain Xu316) TaxID=1245528 RepID=M3HK66_CANMX|nr:hypothetical protein G210_1774 [Candida maltosa Xu316]
MSEKVVVDHEDHHHLIWRNKKDQSIHSDDDQD